MKAAAPHTVLVFLVSLVYLIPLLAEEHPIFLSTRSWPSTGILDGKDCSSNRKIGAHQQCHGRMDIEARDSTHTWCLMYLRGGSSSVRNLPSVHRRRLQKKARDSKEKTDENGQEDQSQMEVGMARSEVEVLLSKMLVHDGSVVRDAELEAEDEYDKPYFSDTLMKIVLDASARMDIRQLAASVLRQSLPASWNSMSSTLRKKILKSLSDSLRDTESVATSLKRQIAVLVAVVTPLVDTFMEIQNMFQQVMEMCRWVRVPQCAHLVSFNVLCV